MFRLYPSPVLLGLVSSGGPGPGGGAGYRDVGSFPTTVQYTTRNKMCITYTQQVYVCTSLSLNLCSSEHGGTCLNQYVGRGYA